MLAFLANIPFCKVNAQSYKSIFGHNSTSWEIVATNLDVLTKDSVSVDGDTVFNSKMYKKIYSYYPTYSNMLRGFLREDTIAGKVWYYSLSDNTEKLIMNMSLNVGDSVYLHIWPDTGWVSVESVYYDLGRKYILLNTNFSNGNGWGEKLLYIEGVGTNRGIQFLSTTMNTSPYLLCSYKDNELIYTNSNPNFNGCYLISSKVNDFQNNDFSYLIFPNPTSCDAILKLNNSDNQQYTLDLYDFYGVKISEYETNSTSMMITRGALDAGVYFYKLYNKSNLKYYFGKIIFTNK
jgi:hypothetical protein